MNMNYYIVEKDDKNEWDVFRTSNISIAIAEKLTEDFPVSVCRRIHTEKAIFVVKAVNATDAMNKFEKFIRLPNFKFKER